MGQITRMSPHQISLFDTKLPADRKWSGAGHAGGPAPGSNAVFSGIMRAADAYGRRGVVTFVDGFKGMLEGNAVILTPAMVSGMEREGGVFCGTARFNPTEKQIDQIIGQLRAWGIEESAMAGGEDTNTTVKRMAEKGYPIVGIPKTIDNDVPGTAITYGFRTVVDRTAEELVALKNDAMAQDENAVYVTCIMGRKSGSWTLEAGRAAGATSIVIPEEFTLKGLREILGADFPRKDDILRRIAGMLEIRGAILAPAEFVRAIESPGIADGDLRLNATLLAQELARTIADRVDADLRYAIFAVAEGIGDRFPSRVVETDESGRPTRFEVLGLGEKVVIGVDKHHNPRFSDINLEEPLTRLVKKAAKEIGLPVKVVARSFGYQFRAIAPSAYDVNLALSLGHEAVKLLVNRQYGRMVIVRSDGEIGSVAYGDLPYDEHGHLVPRTVPLDGSSYIQGIADQFYKRRISPPV